MMLITSSAIHGPGEETLLSSLPILFFILQKKMILCLIYNIQGKMFGISRETINSSIYLFFGGYKIFWLIFNAVPYVALLIIRKE